MEFGVSVPTDPPTEAQVEKVKLAEANGFDYGWVWDTHILTQEYSPLTTLVATQTQSTIVGSCVTNPVTRHPTVVASFFATLANIVGADRLICGIGRGDSAVRIRKAKPNNMWVGGLNRVGVDQGGGPTDFYGRSFFSGPTGDVVCCVASEHDAILYCEIDTEVSAQFRDEWGFFCDRRPDMYGALVAP